MSDKTKSFIQLAVENHKLTHATIEVLTECNCRCIHCYIPEHNSYGLSFETLVRIFKELREIGVFEITFTGGEFFIRRDACDILRAARDLGFNINLFSNISLLTPTIVEEIAGLYLCNVSCTVFSLNSQIHDSITGVPGSLAKILSSIEMIRKHPIPLEIKTILMKANANAYIDLIPFCAERKIKYLATTNIFPKQNYDMLPSEMLLSGDELKKVLSDIDGIRDFDKPRGVTDNDYICNSIHHSIYVDCKGDVYPCNLLPLKLGSLLEESLSNIWMDKSRFCGVLDYRWGDIQECASCKSKQFCYRCTGLAYAATNSLLEKDESNCVFSNARIELFT